jgi:23S rRNA (cytidine2498-2'-O)-methyltransferase
MHLLLWAEASEAELRAELTQSFPGAIVRPVPSSLLGMEFDLCLGGRLPHLAFARQFLPQARLVRAESIRAWANELFQAVAGILPDDKPWSLHLEPHYGAPTAYRMGARAWYSTGRASRPGEPKKPHSPPAPQVGAEAGRHRCQLIREAVMDMLRQKRRHLLRQLRGEPAPFTADEALVQLLLTAPGEGFLSVAAAPAPFEQRHLISPFPKGEVPVASDPTAPSRAFAKLEEAELRLGRAIQAGETCVDLGASPGSWTYVALKRGAQVLAVDRSPLREDLMRDPHVQFHPGDAFRFQPPRPVDWLLCDVIAAPERTAELLLEWLRRAWCRYFVVTVKLKDTPGSEGLTRLKQELPSLTRELYLTRLCANKKEVCAFGERR